MSELFDNRVTGKAKETFFASLNEGEAQTTELLASWQRSQAAIGDPGNLHDVPHVPEALLDEHLLDMFGAPLNRFAEDLEGTGLALLLADSRGQILERWAEDRQAESHLDRVGTVRGAVLAENVVGTNGVGTVATLGKPVQIRGTEHFADFYQDAVCTGAPVLHPMTKKLLAILTISCDMTPRSDLLKPLVRTMTSQLEQHVLSVEQPNSREMLNLFMEISRSRNVPVVAFGPSGAMIQSSRANTLAPHDMNLIRLLSEERRPNGSYVVELSTGPVRLDLTSVGPNNSVVVVGESVDRRSRTPQPKPLTANAGRSPEWLAVTGQVDRARMTTETTLLVGETGVGKTSLALKAPYIAGYLTKSVLCDAAERHIIGSREWLTKLSGHLQSDSVVVVRGIETLDAPALDGMRALLEAQETSVPVLMTLTSDNPEEIRVNELRFGARSIRVPALRDHVSDLPDLWQAIADSLAPGARLIAAPETLLLLMSYSWPGNVKELRRLISQLVASGKSGSVTPSDLPPAMQSSKTLSMIERVELEAIRKALQEAKGNRVKAADILGISRATVYRKMKAYRISGE
jgi:transcriptional regulator of acetoin/glycerol metabolism